MPWETGGGSGEEGEGGTVDFHHKIHFHLGVMQIFWIYVTTSLPLVKMVVVILLIQKKG